MPATYEPIATTTLGSAAASITFSSIPSTYTDLRLVVFAKGTTGGGISVDLKFNSTGSTGLYSYTRLQGSGTSATSSSNTDTNQIYLSGNLPDAGPQLLTADIFSYSGSTYKTALLEMNADANGSGSVQRQVGLWRSTSAITSIYIIGGGGNLGTGTVATLYGILKA